MYIPIPRGRSPGARRRDPRPPRACKNYQMHNNHDHTNYTTTTTNNNNNTNNNNTTNKY